MFSLYWGLAAFEKEVAKGDPSNAFQPFRDLLGGIRREKGKSSSQKGIPPEGDKTKSSLNISQ